MGRRYSLTGEEMREAVLYERLEGDRVRCSLCAHRCLIPPSRKGICLVRENQGGALYSLNYARVAALNVDPVEKKPLFHFLPGTSILSLATVGCNFRCRFCQNWDLSQFPRNEGGVVGRDIAPEAVVALAREQGCESIAFTYSEPTIFFEYAYDVARAARSAGLKSAFVSNGYMTPEAVDLIQPYLDAVNVDLKGFRDEAYRRVMGATLAPVCESIRYLRQAGIWVEVTTLVIPGVNDSDEELREVARFLVGIHPGIPWHVTAFHPDYKMQDRPPTPPETLRRARGIGLEEGLLHVYTGNVPGEEGEHTYCPVCHRALIRRRGYRIVEFSLVEGRCSDCGTAVEGIGMARAGARA